MPENPDGHPTATAVMILAGTAAAERAATALLASPILLVQAAEPAEVDVERRTITGTIAVFGAVGNTSAGPTRFLSGSIAWTDPKRVKLLREHDRENPVGFAASITEDDDRLVATFRVPEGPAGDLALHEAAEGLRDGLSVGVEPITAAMAKDDVLEVAASTMREVSQVAIPAFDDCRVTHVAASLRAASTPPTPTDPGTPPNPPTREDSTVPDALPTTPPEGTPPPPPNGPNGTITATTQGVSLDRLTTLIAAAQTGTLDAEGHRLLTAALSDVIPANTGDAFFRPAYADELWNEAGDASRPMIDAFTTKPLPRALKIKAFQWTTKPAVGDYAGDKTAVPSGPVALAPLEVPVTRTAGAHDIDRAYIDLGSPDFLAAYFQAMTEDYRRKTEAKFAAYVVANAPLVADRNAAALGQENTLLDAILSGAIALLGNGHTPSVVAVGAALLRDLFGITTNNAPAFLQGQVSLAKVADQRIGDLQFTVSPGITDRSVIVGAKTSATFWEANPPVRVQALNVANGGVDAGVFGYHAMAITNTLAIRRAVVA